MNKPCGYSPAVCTSEGMAAALVAVIDDDAAILDLMQDILQEQGLPRAALRERG